LIQGNRGEGRALKINNILEVSLEKLFGKDEGQRKKENELRKIIRRTYLH
jgi:hypothetical protein